MTPADDDISPLGWYYYIYRFWPLIVLLQGVCAFHILYTRNDYWWLWVILVFPFIGSVIYLFHELAPDFRQSGMQGVLRRLMPTGARIRQARERVEEADTVENRVALAGELRQAGKFDEALQVLEPCLEGMYKDDAYVLIELADIQFRKSDFTQARETLLKIAQKCPKDVLQRTKLLLARSYEALHADAEAEATYKEILPGSSGEEVRCRYAEFLIRKGRPQEARPLLEIIRKNWKGSPSLYKRHERPWYRAARKQLRAIRLLAKP